MLPAINYDKLKFTRVDIKKQQILLVTICMKMASQPFNIGGLYRFTLKIFYTFGWQAGCFEKSLHFYKNTRNIFDCRDGTV
jgi:hypothetical protein